MADAEGHTLTSDVSALMMPFRLALNSSKTDSGSLPMLLQLMCCVTGCSGVGLVCADAVGGGKTVEQIKTQNRAWGV